MEQLAWPAVVIILGFGFLFTFKPQIAGLIDRIKEVGKNGLKTFDERQPRAPEKPDALVDFLAGYDSAVLRNQEANIRIDLERRGLTEPKDAEAALVRSLAETQLILHFERFQALIWASQVNLLTYLNSQPDGVSIADAQRFLDEGKTRDPLLYGGYSFDRWLSFMVASGFLERGAERIGITDLGREFLKWRIEAKKRGPFHG